MGRRVGKCMQSNFVIRVFAKNESCDMVVLNGAIEGISGKKMSQK